MYEHVISLMGIPEVAHPIIPKFLRECECKAIELMGTDRHTPEALAELLAPVVEDPEEFIRSAFYRAVISKDFEGDQLFYTISNFWKRITFFAQYEPDDWGAVDPDIRTTIDDMYVDKYAREAQPRLEVSLQDPTQLIENAFFFTLEETLDFIEHLDQDEFYVVPCNCKALARNCLGKKPNNVCINFQVHPNSDVGRGHGRVIDKAECLELVREFNRQGLMQTTEMGHGLCNCCGCCCYPIRASQRMGAKGLWPKQMYKINWDEEKCISCGKCAKICNFSAFVKEGKTVTFDQEKCWGCTICSDKCPTGAISLERIAELDTALQWR